MSSASPSWNDLQDRFKQSDIYGKAKSGKNTNIAFFHNTVIDTLVPNINILITTGLDRATYSL